MPDAAMSDPTLEPLPPPLAEDETLGYVPADVPFSREHYAARLAAGVREPDEYDRPPRPDWIPCKACGARRWHEYASDICPYCYGRGPIR